MNNMKVTVISPIHIGDNDNRTLSSLSDFIYAHDHVKLVDHNKMQKIFQNNPAFMEDYIKEVSSHAGAKYDLSRFLVRYKIRTEEILAETSIPVVGKLDGKEIHPFISENGKRYLPGSTIKGAIRNALAIAYIRKHPKIIANLKDKNYRIRNRPDFANEDKKIFGDSPFYDILKYLQVSDSSPFARDASAIFTCKPFHLKKQVFSFPINYECIQSYAVTDLRLTIKDLAYKRILDNLDTEFWTQSLTVDGIFSAVNAFSSVLIQREIQELSSVREMSQTVTFYRSLLANMQQESHSAAYLCVGKGTTIFGKTMLLALSASEQQNIKKKMKETKAARNFGWVSTRREGMKSSDRLPVMRMAYPSNNGWLAGMGWLKLEKI